VVLTQQHDPNEWRVFIDYSKVSLKSVLLRDGNKLPSESLAHGADIKEFYERIKLLLEKIKCEKYNWNHRGDLKIFALLLGLQLGRTEFFFLCVCVCVCARACVCDIMDKKYHYIQK
jgi:hypothetical protein